MGIKFGCQTITFGVERHLNDFEGILKTLSEAGYDGMENGFARFDHEKKPKFYKKLLKKYNIKLLAIHVGGNFLEEDSVKQQMESFPAIIKLAKKLDCNNIFISGKREDGINGDYSKAAGNMDKIGAAIKAAGLKLSYHNHDWEIENNCKGLYEIAENSKPENLSFVLDVGWVTKGGADPIDVINKLGDRVSNLHFKEFSKEGTFTEVGKGVVNFKGVADLVKDRDMWVIAEQDQTTIGVEESVKYNAGALKSYFK